MGLPEGPAGRDKVEPWLRVEAEGSACLDPGQRPVLRFTGDRVTEQGLSRVPSLTWLLWGFCSESNGAEAGLCARKWGHCSLLCGPCVTVPAAPASQDRERLG